MLQTTAMSIHKTQQREKQQTKQVRPGASNEISVVGFSHSVVRPRERFNKSKSIPRCIESYLHLRISVVAKYKINFKAIFRPCPPERGITYLRPILGCARRRKWAARMIRLAFEI